MLRMQGMAFPPIFKFQTFSVGVFPHTPLYMRGMSATHMAFSHCLSPSNILCHIKGPFSKNPPPPLQENP